MERIVYGTLPDGRQVEKLSFRAGRFFFSVLTYGAVLEGFGFDDTGVVLSHDSLEGYLTIGGFLGAVVGPYANRIGGARFSLDGREYSLERNEGENNLHSGTACFGRKLWSVIGVSENGCTLGLATPALAGGFPGAHEAMVSYTLSDKGVLTLDYTVSSDEKCPVSVTNHAYFNLNGRKSTVMNHILAMDAEGYLEVDAGKIPVAVVPVDGTDFDFRSPQLVGSRRGGDYDHCFTLPPEPHIHAEGDAASMDVLTTEPGIQIYTGGGLKQDHDRFEGICFETGRYPDTPNHPDFPQAFSDKGKPYRTTTSFVLKPKR